MSMQVESRNSKDWIEFVLASLGSTYFFTLGYLFSFKIPESPSLTDAGFFFVRIVAASIAEKIWELLFASETAWALIIIGLLNVLLRLPWKPIFQNFPWKAKHYRVKMLLRKCGTLIPGVLDFVVRLFQSRIILGISFCALFHRLLLTLTLSGDVFLVPESGSAFAQTRAIFLSTAILGVFLFPILTLIVDVGTNLAFRIGSHCLIALVCFSANYGLSYNFAGRFMQFPALRIANTEEYEFPLIWQSQSVRYYVQCKKHGEWKIIGIKDDGNKVFEDFLDRSRFPGICKSL